MARHKEHGQFSVAAAVDLAPLPPILACCRDRFGPTVVDLAHRLLHTAADLAPVRSMSSLAPASLERTAERAREGQRPREDQIAEGRELVIFG